MCRSGSAWERRADAEMLICGLMYVPDRTGSRRPIASARRGSIFRDNPVIINGRPLEIFLDIY